MIRAARIAARIAETAAPWTLRLSPGCIAYALAEAGMGATFCPPRVTAHTRGAPFLGPLFTAAVLDSGTNSYWLQVQRGNHLPTGIQPRSHASGAIPGQAKGPPPQAKGLIAAPPLVGSLHLAGEAHQDSPHDQCAHSQPVEYEAQKPVTPVLH